MHHSFTLFFIPIFILLYRGKRFLVHEHALLIPSHDEIEAWAMIRFAKANPLPYPSHSPSGHPSSVNIPFLFHPSPPTTRSTPGPLQPPNPQTPILSPQASPAPLLWILSQRDPDKLSSGGGCRVRDAWLWVQQGSVIVRVLSVGLGWLRVGFTPGRSMNGSHSV